MWWFCLGCVDRFHLDRRAVALHPKRGLQGVSLPLIPLSRVHPSGRCAGCLQTAKCYRAGTVAVETSARWMHEVTRAIVPAHQVPLVDSEQCLYRARVGQCSVRRRNRPPCHP